MSLKVTYPNLVYCQYFCWLLDFAVWQNVPLGETAWILGNSNALNLTEWSELLVQLLWGGLEEEVSHVDGARWLSLVSWWGREGVLSCCWSIVPCGNLLLDSLLGLGGNRLGLLLDVLNGRLNLLLDGLPGGVVAAESRDDGGLLADGEWGGWSRCAESGGGWGGDGAECGSFDEVPE